MIKVSPVRILRFALYQLVDTVNLTHIYVAYLILGRSFLRSLSKIFKINWEINLQFVNELHNLQQTIFYANDVNSIDFIGIFRHFSKLSRPARTKYFCFFRETKMTTQECDLLLWNTLGGTQCCVCYWMFQLIVLQADYK